VPADAVALVDRQEQRAGAAPAAVQPPLEADGGGRGDVGQALLVVLAPHALGPLPAVVVGEVECDELGAAQPAGVEHGDECRVAHGSAAQPAVGLVRPALLEYPSQRHEVLVGRRRGRPTGEQPAQRRGVPVAQQVPGEPGAGPRARMQHAVGTGGGEVAGQQGGQLVKAGPHRAAGLRAGEGVEVGVVRPGPDRPHRLLRRRSPVEIVEEGDERSVAAQLLEHRGQHRHHPRPPEAPVR